jgi:hypothetical protein
MSTGAEWSRRRPARVSAAEIARRRGVEPIATVDELALPDLFETDEEYEAFLTDLYATRRADVP